MNRPQVIALALLTLLLPMSLFAQMKIKFRGTDGWGIGSRYEQLYNVVSLQTVSGNIETIDTITPFRDMGSGIVVAIKTQRELIPVILGPAWYMLHQDMRLNLNTKIEVRGCQTMIDGNKVIIAERLIRGDSVLLLRDKDGTPNWCSWRKRM